MAVVLDTNVVAYAFLRTEPFQEEAARVLAEAGRWVVPASFHGEFANVLWLAERDFRIVSTTAYTILNYVATLTHGRTVDVVGLWEEAYSMAMEKNHPVYDTLFAALAQRQSSRVLTYDKPFRAKFPDLTIAPSDFLAGKPC